MMQKDSIIQCINDYISTSDYYLVDVRVSTDNHVVVEIDSFEGVSLDYCIQLTRHIESVFDREVEDYELEVGSAGLTEPFKVLKQYEKNIGNEVEVLTKAGKKMTGLLTQADSAEFTLEIEKTEKQEGAKRKVKVAETIAFSYEDIKHTKYIIRFK